MEMGVADGENARTMVEAAIQNFQLFEKVATGPSYPRIDKIPLVARKDLADKPSGEVVICPSRIEGVEFLKKYNAWGFVTISKTRNLSY